MRAFPCKVTTRHAMNTNAWLLRRTRLLPTVTTCTKLCDCMRFVMWNPTPVYEDLMMWRLKKTVHLKNLGLSSNHGGRLLFGGDDSLFTIPLLIPYDNMEHTISAREMISKSPIVPIAICVINFGAHIIILSIVKDVNVKILVLMKWSYRSPLPSLLLGPILGSIFWACSPILFNTCPFWCPFLDPHLTTFHSNIRSRGALFGKLVNVVC